MTSKQEYISLIERACQREGDRLPAEIEKSFQQAAESTPLFGYFPPRWMLDYAAACAFLYARRGEARLVEQAKEALFFYRDWLKHLPPGAEHSRPEYEDGIPPMEPVFNPVVFVPAVEQIRPALSAGELETLSDLLARTFKPVFRFPEWGGHNRAMLRAAGLALGARAFPDHPQAPAWAALADELAEESWGRWSIEDAMLYQPHWLRALIRYAEARGREAELKDMLQPRLHLKAMTQLLSPLGILPDYGDSHWLMHSQWEWLACLEWGAAAYQDPALKWAARRIFETRQADAPDAYLATVAALAWEWCDESVPARPPLDRDSALDDLVIKKLVWRTGWGGGDAYACLNYRDEGDYGRAARDYLRATLAVSAEKMHHGHADECSFSMLVHNGTLLLHESGYRERPPDGIYRAAVYHNRLIWQPGRKPAGLGLLEFLRGDGRYQPTRTERLYHTRLGEAEFSRVRVVDETQGLAWDRSVIFLPNLPAWVVLDGALATRTGPRTISSLWWTTDVLARGEGWFDTHLQGVMGWANRKEAALWIAMPGAPSQPGTLSVEPFRRHFQDELALARTWYGEHRAGRCVNFVTVLWPHAYGEPGEDRFPKIEVVESEPLGAGIGVWLRWGGVERLFGVLNDLARFCGQEDVRPTYSAGQGPVGYGPLRSDAAFVFLRKEAGGEWAGFIHGTHLSHQGQVLYQGRPHAMFQEDATDRPGVPARFRWESS